MRLLAQAHRSIDYWTHSNLCLQSLPRHHDPSSSLSPFGPSFPTFFFLLCFTVSVYYVFLGQTRNGYNLLDHNWPTAREGQSYGGSDRLQRRGAEKSVCGRRDGRGTKKQEKLLVDSGISEHVRPTRPIRIFVFLVVVHFLSSFVAIYAHIRP
jgi:hypothetical protein